MNKVELQIALIVRIAQADGKVTEEEKAALRNFCDTINYSLTSTEFQNLFDNEFKFNELLVNLSGLTMEDKLETLSLCYRVANSDTNYSIKEKELIYSIAKAIGMKTDDPAKLDDWFNLIDLMDQIKGKIISARMQLFN